MLFSRFQKIIRITNILSYYYSTALLFYTPAIVDQCLVICLNKGPEISY